MKSTSTAISKIVMNLGRVGHYSISVTAVSYIKNSYESRSCWSLFYLCYSWIREGLSREC